MLGGNALPAPAQPTGSLDSVALVCNGGAAKTAEEAEEAADSVAGVRKATLQALAARRQDALKRSTERKPEPRAAEGKEKERWSGLRITERCVRQEKWDTSMRGKDLVIFDRLSVLKPAGKASSVGKDQVVIGVLCATVVAPQAPPSTRGGGNLYAELLLTDLDVNAPKTKKLTLTSGAAEHWACADGAGRRHCTPGSILAVLNPAPVRRGEGMTVSVETQVLKLGTCPSFRRCDAKNKDGFPCGKAYNAEGGTEFCSTHARMSYADRQRERAGLKPLRQQGSRCERGSQAPQRPQGVVRVSPSTVTTATNPPSRSAELELEVPRWKRKAPEQQSAAAVAASEAADEASLRLAAAVDVEGNNGVQLLLGQLEELEVQKFGAEAMRGTMLYEQVGALVSRLGAVGTAAKRLRRSWRLLLDVA